MTDAQKLKALRDTARLMARALRETPGGMSKLGQLVMEMPDGRELFKLLLEIYDEVPP